VIVDECAAAVDIVGSHVVGSDTVAAAADSDFVVVDCSDGT
jgi:hypothetical protein